MTSPDRPFAGELDTLPLPIADFPFGGVLLFDRDFRYVAAGGKDFTVIGVDPADVIGLTPSDVWPAAAARVLEKHFCEALEGEMSTVRIPYGSWHYDCWIGPRTDDDKNVVGGFIMTWEVTESVELEGEHALLQAALQEVPVGLTVAEVASGRDGGRPLILVNDGFCRMTGYDREEVIGHDCRFMQGPETDPDRVTEISEALEMGRSTQVTLRNYRKDGDLFWNRLSIFPVRSDPDSDEVTHFIGIQEDVTEHRRLGREAQHGERMRLVGQVAGGVAHDLRNVLMGAGGLLELALRDEELDDGLRSDLEETRQVLLRGSSVTSRLLAFASDQAFDRAHVEVGKAVEDRSGFFRHLIPENIEIQFDGPDELAWIVTDEGQLDRILLNLVKNAEEAMPDGGRLTLAVECRGELPTGIGGDQIEEDRDRWVVVSVHDTGVGMSAAVLGKCMEPFFTTRRGSGGTGLGLASVYGLMQQLGGGVTIESEEGVGTTVRLAFPWAGEPEGRTEDHEATQVEESASGAGGGRILLVEDEEAVRNVCERVLRRAGYEVTALESAPEALGWLAEHHHEVDMLVTDVVLRSGTGLQVAQALHEFRADAPVLMMSGYADIQIDPSSVSDRFDRLSKPFEVGELVLRVGAMLRGS